MDFVQMQARLGTSRALLHKTSHLTNQGVAQSLLHPFNMAKPLFLQSGVKMGVKWLRRMHP